MRQTLPFFVLITVLFSRALTGWCAAPDASESDPRRLTVERIFADKDFETESFGPFEWLDEGDAYTTVEDVSTSPVSESEEAPTAEEAETAPPEENEAASEEDEEEKEPQEIVRYATATGERSVLVSAQLLTPAGATSPLSVDDYEWSKDNTKLLVFTNTKKVWRENTRGDYWVLELATGSLRRVGSGATASSLMFAKFSPDASRVAYVRENNIYIESLATGETVPVTGDGDAHVVNGTFDWVYEEEFDLRDGFRWSPDGASIAYWQLDTNGIRDFYMLNNTDALYPTLTAIPYPKVGTQNSAARIGIAPAEGGETVWMDLPGDPRENYLASMEWVADGSGLLIEQLNRLQNHRKLWRTDSETGSARVIFADQDEAWVDMRARYDWNQSDTSRLILSERDGWRHAYRVTLANGRVQLLTPGNYDVINLVGMDEESGWLYFTASPESPIHQDLYRVPTGGGAAERVTPMESVGFHEYDVSPNGKWAVHTYSRLNEASQIELISLPGHQRVRVLEGNEKVRTAVAALDTGPIDFFQVHIDDPQSDQPLALDGWMIKPPDFDAAKKYPVVFYVYTEPWGQTARDVWGRDRHMWHMLLSQQGYIVATVDNRGTPAPRGRAWRKAIYRRIGDVNTRDQAAAAEALFSQFPFMDRDRVAVWGWSGGGTATLNAMFQHPEIYHVGMAVAAIGDELLYDTIYQERYMGLPDDNAQGYERGSAVTHAKHLQGHLLIVHGTGDDNVHYQNAEVVMNELIRHNRPFDMMSYPNRSHAIREGKNTRVHLFELLTRYLQAHLPAGAK